MWGYIAVLVISAFISYAMAPKPPNQKPPSLDDVDAPTAEEGKPFAVVFGTVWMTGPNVIWYGDLRTTPIKKKAGK